MKPQIIGVNFLGFAEFSPRTMETESVEKIVLRRGSFPGRRTFVYSPGLFYRLGQDATLPSLFASAEKPWPSRISGIPQRRGRAQPEIRCYCCGY